MKTPPCPEFCAEYRHQDGYTYIFSFHARDFDDARIHLRSIGGNAEILGQIQSSISAGIPGAGIYVRLSCWWSNFLAKFLK